MAVKIVIIHIGEAQTRFGTEPGEFSLLSSLGIWNDLSPNGLLRDFSESPVTV